jgi:(heptosyl)LPS beta-1,4-glucosyltransferase
MKPSIAAIIITKNEEGMIANCMGTLGWCDEVIVIDTGSSDHTVEVAKKLGAQVATSTSNSFAERRNAALKLTKADWLFYIDADERVTPVLSKEILVQIETTPHHALSLHRQNIMYGKPFLHGGWQNEHLNRVFRHSHFHGWKGEIHESSVFEGEAVALHDSLLHFTHRNTIDGLKKTIAWTPVEAQLLYQAGTPAVTPLTLVRKGVMEFVRRAIFQKGSQDGAEGWIEAMVQGINRILVYIQLWELQQKPSLSDKYHQEELKLVEQWKKEK